MKYEHNGKKYIIERCDQMIGYQSSKVKYNQDGTPKCRKGWSWHPEGFTHLGGWALTATNCKAQIRGEDTDDVCFA